MRRLENSEFVSRAQLLLQYLLATGMTIRRDGAFEHHAAVIPPDTPATRSTLQVASTGMLPKGGFSD